MPCPRTITFFPVSFNFFETAEGGAICQLTKNKYTKSLIKSKL